VLYAGGLLGAVLLVVWLFCIVDVIMTPADECRHLPKLLWLGLVILLGDIGSALWLLVGRPWANGSPLERMLGRIGSGVPRVRPPRPVRRDESRRRRCLSRPGPRTGRGPATDRGRPQA
jgi:hypothetical protein